MVSRKKEQAIIKAMIKRASERSIYKEIERESQHTHQTEGKP